MKNIILPTIIFKSITNNESIQPIQEIYNPIFEKALKRVRQKKVVRNVKIEVEIMRLYG